MALGLVGRKVGMTRIFTEDGVSIPVTVIEATPNRIAQIKSDATDGYNALQVTAGTKKASRVNKASAGHFAKAGVEAGRGLWEFQRLTPPWKPLPLEVPVTSTLLISLNNSTVSSAPTSKSPSPPLRRNFSMQDATHGNSLSHRAPGSIGQNQSPGKVFKGKKMAGHMGAERVTTQNLELVRVDAERNLLLVKGAVPGAIGGDVIVKPAVKA